MSEDEYDDYPAPGKSGSGQGSGYFGPGPSGASGGAGGSSGGLGASYLPGTSGGGGSSAASRNQVCCLLDDTRRCHRAAGNASYSKRIQRTAFYKRLKLEIDTNVS